MDYQKITIELKPDTQDFRDIAMATLGDVGFESFMENGSNIEAFIRNDVWAEAIMQEISFEPLFAITWEAALIPDQNWNEVWEKNYFQPLLIANRCLIRAPFHTEYPKAEYELVIEPKMAFGTGNHETTSLMIEYILQLDFVNSNVLDMGCGTGVLAMLSSLKGANEVTAIDIDQWAFESTSENCALNNCHNVGVFQGDANLLGSKQYDIIFANIHKNVLIEDLKKYEPVLKEGGILLMSGFYENDLEDITREAASVGIHYLSHKSSNKWVAACYVKKPAK